MEIGDVGGVWCNIYHMDNKTCISTSQIKTIQ